MAGGHRARHGDYSCDGGDPAVWFAHSELFASSLTGESVSRMQAKDGGANTLHGRLSPSSGTCRDSVVESAADNNNDDDGNSRAGSVASPSGALCRQGKWELEGGGNRVVCVDGRGSRRADYCSEIRGLIIDQMPPRTSRAAICHWNQA
jgi:hypothetical protein